MGEVCEDMGRKEREMCPEHEGLFYDGGRVFCGPGT